LPIWKVPIILSIMENTSEPHIPSAAEASAALNDAEEARATLAQSTKIPSWFFASIGAAIAVQIASTAVGVAHPSSLTLAALASGIAILVAVAGVQLARFRRLNGVRLGGLVSRVVFGTGTLASASYAAAAVFAILGAFDKRWWLVVTSSIIGGALYALNGRRWLRAYQAEPALHARGESLTSLTLLTVTALASLALLLLYR
jgi:hypothetical protein